MTFKKVCSTAVLSLATASMMSACSSSSDSAATANNLTVSGGIANATLMALKPSDELGLYTPMFAATDYTMICSMLVSPFTSGNSALQTDGSFSLTIAGAAGNPIGCMLAKSGAIVAVMSFVSSSDNMSTTSTGGAGLSTNSDSTSITLPAAMSISGQTISVATTDVTQNGSTASTVAWTDPTGTWIINKQCQFTIDPTTGTPTETCMAGGSANGSPESVYLYQFSATKASNTRYGLSVWASSAARTACGDKEGFTPDNGWAAVGTWAGDFTNSTKINIFDAGTLNAAAAKALALGGMGQTQDPATTVCDKTIPTPGTSKCSDVDWTGGGWGMGADACKLHCVMQALNRGGDETSSYDWGTECPRRYKVNWQNNNELAADADYNNSNGVIPGKFATGYCSNDSTFDGCKDTASGKVLFEIEKGRGPKNRFMNGELFVTGNLGTLSDVESWTGTFFDSSNGSSVTCTASHISKMTVLETSATTAKVTVENTTVASPANPVGCATNSDFNRHMNDKMAMSIEMTKQ